jgi:DNA ligase (NAD+)
MTPNQQPVVLEVFDEPELLAFDREMRELLEQTAELQYVVEPRISGVEVGLVYEQGTLKSASDRTGTVTSSIKTVLTVPLTLVPLRKETSVPVFLEIVADFYMEEAALARLNEERKVKNLPAFPDVKTAVEDSLHQTDTRISYKRPVNYFCSGCRKGAANRAATHSELMLGLQELGLRLNRPHLRVGRGIRGAIEQCRRLKAQKGDFPYPVEGALIRLNSLDLQERLSHGSENRPEKVVFRF